jgi:hypothetical protein
LSGKKERKKERKQERKNELMRGCNGERMKG